MGEKMKWLIEFGLLCILIAPHLFAKNLHNLEHYISPKRWLSFCGGVSMAYVFITIFPEFPKGQHHFDQITIPFLSFLNHHVYLIALAGLSLFYGLELLACTSRNRSMINTGQDCTSKLGCWLHLMFFAVYNFIIGWLLHDTVSKSFKNAFLMTFAIALHFVVNDDSLRDHHKHAYDRLGRWILTFAIFAGYLSSHLVTMDPIAVSTLWALVAGGVIFNILKEEAPCSGKNCFISFILGVACYTIIAENVK